MLSDILKGAKPIAIANPVKQQAVAEETLNEKATGKTGFWSGLKKDLNDTANSVMAWVNEPSPSDYLSEPIIEKDKLMGAFTPVGVIPFIAETTKNVFKSFLGNKDGNKAGLKGVTGDDLEYIKSLDKESAFKYLNTRGVVVNPTKTQNALNDYYGARQQNIKRYGLDKIEPPKSIFSNQEENIIKTTKQKAFDTATSLGLSETASARTVQLMEDGFRSTVTGPKISLMDIEDKYNKLKDQGVLNSEAEAIYKNTKDVYNKALPRISEIAVMQAKNVGKSNENTEDLVLKELKEKGFNNVNEYIYQDSKEVIGTNKSLSDYMKGQSASIDLLYQFKKKDGLGYVSNARFWEKGDEVFHSINDVAALVGTNLNSWAQKILSRTNALGLGAKATGFQYGEGDLKFGTYAYTEEGTGMYGRRLAKGADFLPEVASFAVGTKGIDKLLNVGKLGTYLGGASMEGGLAYKMLTGLKLSPQRALQGERMLQNVAYTVLNTIPKEITVGTIGNTWDPKSGSQEQEYWSMFDAGIGGMMGVWRQFKDIKRINSIFQTPEEGKAFLDKMNIEGPTLPQEGLEFFSRFHPTVMKTFEKLNNANIAKGIERGDDLILGLKAEDWNVNSKKAYANAKVRDLYLKNGGQITDADRNLMANMQKLVTDDKINLADIVKLDWNIPGKFTFAGQTSNIKTKVDQFQAALDWDYQKPVDDLFDWQGWTPDTVINKEQLDRMQTNIETKGIFKDLDKGVDIVNKDGVKEFKPYIKEVDDGYVLTREGYEYLGIVDKRTNADEILNSSDGMDVSDALKIARDNGASISDSTISLVQNTDLVDKLISISGC